MTRVWVLIVALLWSGSAFAVAPNWSVNPADFEQSAAVTAALTADFEPVAGADNLLAAFVGSELRGVAAPVEVDGQWLYFLTVYANQSGETLSFKAYLATEDAIFDVQETLSFQSNAISGDPSAPLVFNAIVGFDFPPVLAPIADQQIEVGQTFAAVDLDDHLQSEDGDPVRFSVSGPDFAPPQLNVNVDANNAVTISPPSPGWTGSETLIFTAVEETDNRLTALAEATFTIRLPDQFPRIGPIPDQTIRQLRTFDSFDLDDYLLPSDGDEVAWSLDFSAVGGGAGAPSWSVATAGFERSMSVTAAVTLRGQMPASGSHLLAAFAGNEVRGVAAPVEVGGQTLYFLSVYANAAGEAITFQYYDAIGDQIYPVKETLTFSANALLGDPQNPLALQAGALDFDLHADNVVTIEVLDPAWTGSETVQFTATDQNTLLGLSVSVSATFMVETAVTIYGDVDGDEQVTEQDAEWIMEHVVGTRALAGVAATLADV
ncbi:MAG: hypothetical protein QGH25_08745, partial [Candidatus Latescibacteria bacterium]|nr:hypothetical protein [Candidatus Latescibacterota bacterium]